MRHPPNPEKQEFIRLRLARNARPGGRSRAEARKYYGGIYHRMRAEERKSEVEDGLAREAEKAGRVKEGTRRERAIAGDSGRGGGSRAEDQREGGEVVLDGDMPGEAEHDTGEQTVSPATGVARDETAEEQDDRLAAPNDQEITQDDNSQDAVGAIDGTALRDEGAEITIHTQITVTAGVFNGSSADPASPEPAARHSAESNEQPATESGLPAESNSAATDEEALLLAAIKQSNESDQESRGDTDDDDCAVPQSSTELIANDGIATSASLNEESERVDGFDLPTPPATSPASTKGPSVAPATPERKSVSFDESVRQISAPPGSSATIADEDDGFVPFPDDNQDVQSESIEETPAQSLVGEEMAARASGERDSQIDLDTSSRVPAIPDEKEKEAVNAEDKSVDVQPASGSPPTDDKSTNEPADGKPVEDESVMDAVAQDNLAQAKVLHVSETVQPPAPVAKRDYAEMARAFAKQFGGQTKTKKAKEAAAQRRAAAERYAAAQASDTQSDIKHRELEEDPKAKGKGKKKDKFSPPVSDSEEVNIDDPESEKEDEGQPGEGPEDGNDGRDGFNDDDGEDEDDEGIVNAGEVFDESDDEYGDEDDEDDDDDEIEAHFDNMTSSDLDFLPGAPIMTNTSESDTIDPYDTYEPPPLPSTGEKRKLPQELEGLAPEIAAAFVDHSTGRLKEDGTGREIRTPDGPPQKRPRLRRPGVGREVDAGNVAASETPKSATSAAADDEPLHTPQTPNTGDGNNNADTSEAASKPAFFSSLMNELNRHP